MATVQEQFETLALSAHELRELNPQWSNEMLEEWLNNLRNTLLLATSADANQVQVDQNTANITTNTGNITTNTTNITTNSTNITTNATNITTNATNLTNHEGLTEAHGSNGDVVGFLDLATTSTVGLVLEAVAVTDGVDSTVAVTSADATDLATVITLANELKAGVNTLVTDVNLMNTQFNDLLARLRTSGVLSV